MNILMFQCIAVISICLISLISLKLKNEIYIRVEIPHKIKKSAYKIIKVNEILIIALGLLLYISLIW